MSEILSPPAEPIYAALVREQQLICDKYAEAMLSEHDWALRANLLVIIMSRSIATWSSPARATAMSFERQRFAVTLLLTATLESLGEREICHPAAAMLYLFSAHDQWQAAAQRFLSDPAMRRNLLRHSVWTEFLDMMHKLRGVSNGV